MRGPETPEPLSAESGRRAGARARAPARAGRARTERDAAESLLGVAAGRARGRAEHGAAVCLRAAAVGAPAVAALLPAHAREALGAHAHELDVVIRNLSQEAARRVGRRGAVRAPRGGVGEEQLALGARDGDVGQAAFLLHAGRIVLVALVREDPLLHAGDEHDGELQALRRVYGHHRHGARGAGERVEVASQGKPFHERGKLLGRHGHVGVNGLGGRGGKSHLPRRGIKGARLAQLRQALERLGYVVVRLVELLGHAEELADVLDAPVRLHGVLGLKGGDEAGVVHD